VCGIGRRMEEEKRKREGEKKKREREKGKRRKKIGRGGGIRSKGFALLFFFFSFLFSKDEGGDKDISLGQSQDDMWHKRSPFLF
jgi:hypothetical protein